MDSDPDTDLDPPLISNMSRMNVYDIFEPWDNEQRWLRFELYEYFLVFLVYFSLIDLMCCLTI